MRRVSKSTTARPFANAPTAACGRRRRGRAGRARRSRTRSRAGDRDPPIRAANTGARLQPSSTPLVILDAAAGDGIRRSDEKSPGLGTAPGVTSLGAPPPRRSRRERLTLPSTRILATGTVVVAGLAALLVWQPWQRQSRTTWSAPPNVPVSLDDTANRLCEPARRLGRVRARCGGGSAQPGRAGLSPPTRPRRHRAGRARGSRPAGPRCVQRSHERCAAPQLRTAQRRCRPARPVSARARRG